MRLQSFIQLVRTHLHEVPHPLYTLSETRHITRLIVEKILNRPFLSAHLDTSLRLNAAQSKQCLLWLSHLEKGKPLQYVLGEAHFGEKVFMVNEQVLIPRPETEELIHWVTSYLPPQNAILDIGTGSGNMAISLYQKRKDAPFLLACDSSEAALLVARSNAQRIIGETAIRFFQWDIFTPPPKSIRALLEKTTCFVSNPPYIPLSEKKTLSVQVADYEPPTALFVPDETPFIFYERIVSLAQLFPAVRYCFFELHAPLAADLLAYLRSLFPNFHYTLRKDMQGKNRMLLAEKTLYKQ